MYQALYRKWRPKIFEDVFGQTHITETLKNQVAGGKLTHAYLFSGTRGTGKTSSAKILARAVNCENPADGNPCNECYACKRALSGGTVDIIEMDAASNNKVEDARMIRDEVIYTPAEFKYKVYIIDEAHMLTQSAFNALLKTLEEPPAHIIFIFATTEPHKFPATILSRCQRFDFKRITPNDIAKRIRQITDAEGFNITDEAINVVVRVADGSMRDALSLLDQCVSVGSKDINASDVALVAGVTDPGFVIKFAQSVIESDTANSMRMVKEAYDRGFELSTAIDELLECFRKIMIIKSISDKADALSVLELTQKEADKYFELAQAVSLERILRYVRVLEEAYNSKMFVSNPRISLEIALSGMHKKPDITEPQGMLEKLSELENRVRILESSGVKVAVKEIPKEEAIEEPEAQKEEPPKIISEVVEENEEYVYEAEESADYPVYEQEFEVEPQMNGQIYDAWGDVLIIASKNSLAGFDKIIGDAKAEFLENGVELFFSNEGFLKIAQMNKFDINIQNAFKTVLGTDVSVKLKFGEKASKEKDNFSMLMDKIKGSSDVEFM